MDRVGQSPFQTGPVAVAAGKVIRDKISRGITSLLDNSSGHGLHLVPTHSADAGFRV